MRPAELAREHGLSAQAVRNYERDGILPPAERTPSGHRVYRERHVRALRTFRMSVPAFGHSDAARILRAVNADEVGAALGIIDAGHVALARDRETLDAVASAAGLLAAAPPVVRGDPLSVGELARRVGVVPATLRKWERARVLHPARDRAGHRRYSCEDVRDAELSRLLRRGGYPIDHVATVVAQVRAAGGAGPLAASLAGWRERLDARGRAMLVAAGTLAAYLELGT
ncbi:MAG: MerR family transcriptional regulator [Pseudonocardia sp.]